MAKAKKKKQEKQDLQPSRNLQPKSRTLRYDNVKSAVAEEAVLAMLLKEPNFFAQVQQLQPEMFSAPVLGHAFGLLKQRYAQGMEVSVSVLTELSAEEMAHIAGISQRQEGPVSEAALLDCLQTIRSAYQAKHVDSDDALLAVQKRMQERKGAKP